MRKLIGVLAWIGCAAATGLAQPSAAPTAAWMRQLAEESGLALARVKTLLAQARFVPEVIERMQAPYEARPYAEYRPLFVNDRLIREGKRYLVQHAAEMQAMQARFAVEPEIVAAILGMETHYGERQGKFRVLDALYTLALADERRSAFFRRELAALLRLAVHEGLDLSQLYGSYAGAFGITQFIPSSYLAYAVDGDGDGRRDVWHSHADAIASVGNYFRRHGWQPGRPIAHWLPLQVPAAIAARADEGMKHFSPLASLRRVLPPLPKGWRDEDEVAVIWLEPTEGRRAVLVHRNFYVITRWNRSANYAMAVAELAGSLGCAHCLPSR